MFSKHKDNGQSTLEYTIMISVVIGALLLMQIYMKRGVQGKMRDSADQIGEQFEAGKTSVYSKTDRTAQTVQKMSAGETNTYTGFGGGVKEVRTEVGNEVVGNFE
jgi:hypothetical protein